jgi:hypothetical protein
MTAPCDEAARARIARACRACACDRIYGVVYPCPATMLPRMGANLLVRGETVDIPHMLPATFECPRYAIMGW